MSSVVVRVIAPVPSKLVAEASTSPSIVMLRAVANFVAVAALPVNGPTRDVPVIVVPVMAAAVLAPIIVPSIAPPLTSTVAKVDSPVTPRVPPTVALPVTPNVLSKVAAPVTSNVPAKSTLAPVKVAAVVVPDFTTRLPELLLSPPHVAVASFNNTSPPSTSIVRSPAISTVKSPLDTSISLSTIVVYPLVPACSVCPLTDPSKYPSLNCAPL